jgi:protein-disulfide isomerase
MTPAILAKRTSQIIFATILAYLIATSAQAADNVASPPAQPVVKPNTVAAVPETKPDKPNNPAEPDPQKNPMLAQYLKDGITLYYLGSRSGLDGWFLLKNGQVQAVYTTPDNQSILLGELFAINGDPITESQVTNLTNEHPEILSSVQQNLVAIQQNSLTAKTTMSSDSSFARPVSPGERLVQELQDAVAVNLGDQHARQLFMIMDPNCPHCQAVWKALRDYVFKNTLQIRMVPIGRNDEDERVAGRLLTSKDPLNAWDKYVSGDKTQLSGNADPLSIGAVKANHILIDRWNIKETPYLVYRGKDKKIKVLAGEPQKLDTVIQDIGP